MGDQPLTAWLASCSADGVKVWEVQAAGTAVKQATNFRPPGTPTCVRWSPSNHVLAVGGTSGRVTLSGPQGQVIRTIDCEGKEIRCLSLSAKSCAVGSGTSVVIYDIETGALVHSFQRHSDTVTALAFNTEGTHVLSGSSNGELLLHNAQHGATVAGLSSAGHGGVCDIQYSLWKTNHAGTGHHDGTFICWDVVGRRAVATFQQHTGPALAVAFSTVHAALAVTVGVDKRVIFYDVQQKSVLKVVVTDQSLSALAFMEDGSTVAVGSASGTLLFLDLKRSDLDDASMVSGRMERAHASQIYSLQFQQPAHAKQRRSSHPRVTTINANGRSDSLASQSEASTASTPRSFSTSTTPGVTDGTSSGASAHTPSVTTGVSGSQRGSGPVQRSGSYNTSTVSHWQPASTSTATTPTIISTTTAASAPYGPVPSITTSGTGGIHPMDVDPTPAAGRPAELTRSTTTSTSAAIAISSIISPVKGLSRDRPGPLLPSVYPVVPTPTPSTSTSSVISVTPSTTTMASLYPVRTTPQAVYTLPTGTSVDRQTYSAASVRSQTPVSLPLERTCSPSRRISPSRASSARTSPVGVPPSVPSQPMTANGTAAPSTVYAPSETSANFVPPPVPPIQLGARSTSNSSQGPVTMWSVTPDDVAPQHSTPMDTASKFGQVRSEHAASYHSPRLHPTTPTAASSGAAPAVPKLQ